MGDAAAQKEGLNMPRFFLPKKDIRDEKGVVTGQELEHPRKVLRLRPGDRVTLFRDGNTRGLSNPMLLGSER